MHELNHNRGLTLMEIMCCVAISGMLAVGFAGGLHALRMVQYRSNATARLSAAATEAMEEWSVRAARGETPGPERSAAAMTAVAPSARPVDQLSVEVREVEGEPGLREIIVRAAHPDTRQPVEVELRTFVAVK